MMKWFLMILTVVLFAQAAFSQTAAQKAKEKALLTEKFGLTPSQQNRLDKILDRKYATFSQIRKYQTTRHDVFGKKLAALYEGTINSIRLMLNTDQQLETFRQWRIELRTQKAEFVRIQRKKGLTYDDAEYAFYSKVFFPAE